MIQGRRQWSTLRRGGGALAAGLALLAVGSTTPASAAVVSAGSNPAAPGPGQPVPVSKPVAVQPRPAACPVPSAPTGVSATAGAQQASITWTAANGNGSSITAYVIRETAGPDKGASIGAPAAATQGVLTGLKGGTAATLSVAAISGCGTGPLAAASAVTPTGAASSYVTSVLSTSPSIYYRLGEPASTTLMADSSLNANDGAYSGQGTLGQPPALANDPNTSVSYTTCCSGIGTSPALPPLYNSARTVEAWVETTNAANSPGVVAYGQNGTDQSFVMGIQPNAISVDGYSDKHVISTDHTINDGHWHMIAVTYDGTNITAYLDGRAMGGALFNAPLDTLEPSGSTPFYLGDAPNYSQFNGSMQDVAIFPRALTAAQISSQFSASGYALPGAVVSVHVSTGGNNAATLTWGLPSGVNTGFIVSVASGPNAGQSTSVPAGSTAARLYGLAAGAQTFSVRAFNTFGSGPAVTSAPYTVPGTASSYASVALSDGPSIFYRLGDTSTSVMTDSSGHGYNGSYSTANVTLGQPGPIAGDLTASVTTGSNNTGVGGYPATVLPTYNSPRTIEAWTRTTQSDTSGMTLVSWGVAGTNNAMMAYVYPNSIGIDGYSDNQVFPTPYAINDGLWHLVTFTYDGTTITAYLDGLPIGPGQFASTLDTLPGGLDVGLTIANGGTQYYSSSIADVAVYPTALSAARVAAHFNASGLARPLAPGAPKAVAGANSATVSWTAAASPGSPIQDYVVTALLAGKAVNSQSVQPAATSTVIAGLKGATAYTFKITAVNSYGTGVSATTTAVTPTGTAGTYASNVLSDKPSVFYRLGDTSTAYMADSSGNAASGQYVATNVSQGAAGPLVGDATTSVSSAGSGSGIGSFAASVLPLYNSSRSIEAWFNTTQTTAAMTLVSWGTSGTNDGMAAYVYPNDIAIDGYNDNQLIPTPYPINDGVWHLMDLTYDGSTITAYLDGLPIGTAHFGAPLNTLPGGLSLGIAKWGGNAYNSSALADIAVYPTSLSAARVAAHFTASGIGRPSAPGAPTATGGANSASVSWTAATSSTSPVKDYLVTAMSGTKAVNSQSVTASSSSVVINGLPSGAYTFKITAANSYGVGPAATTASATVTGSSTTYTSSVLADNPTVLYRLGDTALGAMADSSGHGDNGTYQSSASLGQTGPFTSDHTPSVLTGTNSVGAGSFARSVFPLYNSSRTIEGWINTTQTSSAMAIASWGTSGTNNGIAAYAYPNDIALDGYSDNQIFPTPYPIDDGVWRLVDLTYNGTTITAYLDGLPIGTGHFASPLDTQPGGLSIGLAAWGSNPFNSSLLANVAVYPTALSAARVLAHFTASGFGRPGAPGSPAAAAGTGSATVSWTASAANGSPISDYLVTAVLGTKAVNSQSVPASATSTVIRGLVSGSAYTFTITAANSYGAGAVATTGSVTPTGSATTPYASSVLADSPSVFYRLGDTAPASMADSSGHGANGTYLASGLTQGAAGPLPAGDATTAVLTTSGSGVGSFPGSVLPLYNSPRTIEAWVNTTQTSTNPMTIASWGTPGTNNGTAAYIYPSSIALDGYGDNQVFATPYPINDSQWHLVALTYDGTTIKAYLDGLPIGSGHFTGPLNTQPGGLTVGVAAWGGAPFFNSPLADVSVYPTALSAARLLAHFTASGYSRPNAPGAPKATKGTNSATVTWTAPSSGPSAVKGYLVTAMLGTTPVNSRSVPAGTTSTVITGLKGSSAYAFTITAYNSYGPGAAATTASVTPTGATTTYASTVLASSPSVYYRLGDTASALLADSSGNGANGSYNPGTNDTLGQTGALTGDADFSVLGAGSYVATARASLPLYNGARSVEGWVKTTNGGTQYLAGWGVQGTAEAFDVAVGPTSVYVQGYSDDLTFTSPATIDDGNWHFIAVTYDGTTATAYVDGTSLGGQSFTQALNTQPASTLVVGAFVAGYSGVVGDLDELAIFPTALSSATISAQFAAAG